MKTNRILTLAIALILSVVYGLVAQTDIISAKDFMGLMKENPNLVIIDAGKAKSFDNNHVKCAIHINHLDLYQKDNEIDGLILPPDQLAAFFGEKGISENSEIVIYDDGSQKYNTRIYWILKYLGATDVKLLHQDMTEWGKVRIPLTTAVVTLKPATFTPTLHPEVIADIDLVDKADTDKSIVLIDVRADDEYNGTGSGSTGHIPGAIHIEYKMFLTDTGAFKPEEELRKMVEDLGITPDKEIITYCKTSVRAAPVFVAFKNILGYENVKVYDGAYNEWVVSQPVTQ